MLRRHTSTTFSRLKTRLLPALIVLMTVSTGCLYETKRVAPPLVATRTATLDELLTQMERLGAINSIRATVDLGLSFLKDDKEHIKTLTDVRGIVLAERPDKARIQAQYPVTHQTAFDMVSDADEFSVYLVWKKRFIQGPTAVDVRSEERAENIRPQHVIEPLLIDPPQEDEHPAMDNQARDGRLYQVVIFQKQVSGHGIITRKAWFDRATMELNILEIYDDDGNIVTSAVYEGWLADEGVPYASTVRVNRPIDGYTLVVHMRDPGINETVPEDGFTLEPPSGVPVERVGDLVPSSAQANAQ